MEKITSNLAGAVRRERMRGRSYLVAPITLVVPGVLNGSEGPIYYGEKELSRDVDMWDGMPLVGYHPTHNGTPVSARTPQVLDRQGLGFVFKAQFDKVLGAEAWFDEEATLAFDRYLAESNRIVPRLLKNQPVEVSTGLFIGNDGVSGQTADGTPYKGSAIIKRPDHVAVLPDQVGACSVKDGCGVFVTHNLNLTTSQETTMPLTPEQRKGHVDYLVANCSCWKKPGDAVILNSLPDDKLDELRREAEKTSPNPANPNPNQFVITDAVIESLAERLRLKLALPTNPAAPASTPPATTTPAAPAGTPHTTSPAAQPVPAPVSSVPVAQPVTANEWLTTAPAEIRSVFENAMETERREKSSLCDRLVGNVADPTQKQTTHQYFMTKPLAELRLMSSLIPQPVTNLFGPSYLPQGVPPSGYSPSSVDGDDEGVLLPPTINWAENRRKVPSDANA